MTVCGLVRLDGGAARRSTLTAMLASSSVGLPAARGVHLDGPFGVMTGAMRSHDPIPPIAVDAGGLVVVLGGRLRRPGPVLVSRAGEPAGSPAALAGAGSTDACLLAAAYRRDQERCLGPMGGAWIALVWEPERQRLVCARTGDEAEELLTWSDGRIFAFGTEPAQLLAAGAPMTTGHLRPTLRLARIRRLGSGECLAVCLPGTTPARSTIPIQVWHAGQRH
ncbi:hypothetical protein [Frankia sp. Cppng1_Ct_nod]|uniref:hypothetical protein n=1 Tax=Frankia sp. Cppng1_Ct_nod TaxID=2897162 RepID=UPI001041346E|nr:hypothetical protein [Frankia sp. Cppng1_Ct_nod]